MNPNGSIPLFPFSTPWMKSFSLTPPMVDQTITIAQPKPVPFHPQAFVPASFMPPRLPHSTDCPVINTYADFSQFSRLTTGMSPLNMSQVQHKTEQPPLSIEPIPAPNSAHPPVKEADPPKPKSEPESEEEPIPFQAEPEEETNDHDSLDGRQRKRKQPKTDFEQHEQKKLYKRRYQQKRAIKKKLLRFHQATGDTALVVFVTHNSQRQCGFDVDVHNNCDARKCPLSAFWKKHKKELEQLVESSKCDCLKCDEDGKDNEKSSQNNGNDDLFDEFEEDDVEEDDDDDEDYEVKPKRQSTRKRRPSTRFSG